MTVPLPWETSPGGTAGELDSAIPDYISPPAANYLVKRLMRDVTTLSSRFSEGKLVVFSRLVSVAKSTKNEIEFYGLYESGTDNPKPGIPNFCIRRSVWKKKFGDLHASLTDLRFDTVFFNDTGHRLDKILTENFQSGFSRKIIEDVHLNSDRNCASSEYSYFSTGDIGYIEGEFFPKDESLSYVKSIYDALKKTLESCDTPDKITPSINKIRISYSTLVVTEIIEKLKGKVQE